MVDAILSVVAERILSLIEEQARYHVNLVRGAEKEVLSLSKELEMIGDVLDDAENRRFQDKRINRWLSRLEHTSCEMEDVLDEWDYALLKLQMQEHHSDDALLAPSKQKVCSFIPSSSTSWCLCFKKVVARHKIAKKILVVKAQLDELLVEKDRYSFVSSHPRVDPLHGSWRVQSSSLIDSRKVHGRDRDRDILVSKLVDNGGSQEESGIQIVSIVGVGGLGKTTLAQLVYNNSRVEEFFELRVWVCVSDPFNLVVIAKGILECIKVGSSPNTDQLEVLFKQVRESIFGKRFLLVLDDIWTEDSNKWEPLTNSLMCGGVGSKVLVTTRNERVVKMMGLRDNEIYHLEQLSDEDCWLILCRIALSGMNQVEFEDIGRKIAKKCNGLPLATNTLGSLLRFKNRVEEWENILNSEIWKMEVAEVDIFPHLLLSYNELSPTLKRCFSYCVIFPKDSKINVETLIGYWMSLGYLGYNIGDFELKGRECFDMLAMRSLFQDFERDDLDEIQSFKMHDIVHDFAQFVRKSGRDQTRMNKKTCLTCDPSLVSTVNQFCTLFCENETPPILCDCLSRLKVLILANCGLQGLPPSMEKLIHLRLLNLFLIKLSREELKIIFHLYNLQTLSLGHCNIKEIPREIENLAHLRCLDICGNETLQELPREIGNLINLRCFTLVRNLSLEEYPREIGYLINLRDLKLSQNSLVKELPREIGNLIQLRRLDLNDNESLKELPREIGKLIHLRYLSLRGNESMEELPNEIGNLIHLRLLNLSRNKSLVKLPREIGNLIHLRHLDLSNNKFLKELPNEIGNMTQLRLFNLSGNVSLEKLPMEIGNLVHLRRLDLCGNELLEELPREIGKLIRLRYLNLGGNNCLKKIPTEIGNLIHLKHLDLRCSATLELPESICGLQELEIFYCPNRCKLSEGFAQLTSLRSLFGFRGGSGCNKFGLLKNLNHLSGTLSFTVALAVGDDCEEIVDEARKARMRNKIHIEKLHIRFEDEMDENERSSQVRMGVIDALEPHPNMKTLFIWEYKGFQFPQGWMVSPLNQLRNIYLIFCRHLTSLPCLGKLPSLEKITMARMDVLQNVGREFLGITKGDISNHMAFPKLKNLDFINCGKWKEWEDITAEEESSEALFVMPRLTILTITGCESLTALPHRLLRKTSSLKLLKLNGSKVLQQRYTNRNDSDLRFIFQNNPCLQLSFD